MTLMTTPTVYLISDRLHPSPYFSHLMVSLAAAKHPKEAQSLFKENDGSPIVPPLLIFACFLSFTNTISETRTWWLACCRNIINVHQAVALSCGMMCTTTGVTVLQLIWQECIPNQNGWHSHTISKTLWLRWRELDRAWMGFNRSLDRI